MISSALFGLGVGGKTPCKIAVFKMECGKVLSGSCDDSKNSNRICGLPWIG